MPPRHRDAGRPIDLAGGRHIDGKLDVSGKCGLPRVPGATARTSCTRRPSPTRATGPAPSDPLTVTSASSRTTRRAAAPATSSAAATATPLDASKHMDFAAAGRALPGRAPARCARGTRRAPRTTPRPGRCSGVYCHSSGQQAPTFALVPGWTLRRGSRLRRLPWESAQVPVGRRRRAGRQLSHRAHRPGPDSGTTSGSRRSAHASKHGSPRPGEAAHQSPARRATSPPTNSASATGPLRFYWLDTTGSYELDEGDPNRLTDPRWLETQCGTCHGTDGAPVGSGKVMPLTHVNGRRDVVFDTRTTLPSYPGLPRAGHADAPVLGHAVEVLRCDPGRRRHRGRDALARALRGHVRSGEQAMLGRGLSSRRRAGLGAPLPGDAGSTNPAELLRLSLDTLRPP